MDRHKFETDNIDLTAFLLESGITPVGNMINRGRRVSFLFQDTTELRKALVDYETDAVAPAKSLLGQRAACYRIISDMLRTGIAKFSQQRTILPDVIILVIMGFSSIARWLR